MYNIFGFYKFKKITNLKKKKELLDNYLKQENFRGTIILSPEGVNGTISFKIDRYISIRKNIKKILNLKNFDSENLSHYKYQAFHKGKIKIKKELVPIGIKLKKELLIIKLILKIGIILLKKKTLSLLIQEKVLNLELVLLKDQ